MMLRAIVMGITFSYIQLDDVVIQCFCRMYRGEIWWRYESRMN